MLKFIKIEILNNQKPNIIYIQQRDTKIILGLD